MSRWNLCRAALDAHMMALPGVTAARVSWPNRTFTKPTGSIWYAPSMLPQGTDAALGQGGSTHEFGVYQVSVFSPANDGKGTAAALQAVDEVIAHFDRQILAANGMKIQCSVPTPAPMVQETDWIQFPVSIRFIVL